MILPLMAKNQIQDSKNKGGFCYILFGSAGELPQRETPQPGLLIQALPEKAVPKVEKNLRVCFLPHFGHFISLSLSVILRYASNFLPQFVHSYS
jgi:hypothetical protein